MVKLPQLFLLFVAIALFAGTACRLRPPNTTPIRTIEPQLVEPPMHEMSTINTTSVRVLDTQTRAHIGSRVLRRQPDGELVEDAVWRWSSPPERYLDTALRLALASSSDLRIVDAISTPTLSATLLAWHLESDGGTQLVGAIELSLTGIDHAVYTQVIRGSEPVSAELPGDLAAAAGRLLQRMASEMLARVAREASQLLSPKP
jgi:hypothetical protein